MTDPEAVARSRFMLLNLVRFGAVALVFAGIANLAGKLLPELMPWFGYLLFFAGIGGFYRLPIHLKRRWRDKAE